MKATLALLFLSIGWCTPTLALDCTDPLMKTKWDLWTHGSCLRGANIWQVINDPKEFGDALGTGRVGPPFTLENFSQLRSWKANLINISHPGIYTQVSPYRLDVKVQNNLDQLVKFASEAHLYVVISYRTGPGRNEHAFGESPFPAGASLVWRSQKAQDAWVLMWSKTAARYKNHPHVVGYNLMVEPNPNATAVQEWDGAAYSKKYTGSLMDWYKLAELAIQAIRAVDKETPILVSPMNWGDPAWLPWMPTFKDAKVVYNVHQYEPYLYVSQIGTTPPKYPGHFDGDYDGVSEDINKTWLRAVHNPIEDFAKKNKATMAVLEYGLKHRAANAKVFLKDQLDIFDSLNLNHAIWLWETDYSGVDWDDFNFRKATDSGLKTTLQNNWSKNLRFYQEAYPVIPRGRVTFPSRI